MGPPLLLSLRGVFAGLSGFRFHPSSRRHKPSEYNSPPPPPSGWSGGTLDIHWTCPGTTEPFKPLLLTSQAYPDLSPAAPPRRNDSGAGRTFGRDRHRRHGFPVHQVAAPFEPHRSARPGDTWYISPWSSVAVQTQTEGALRTSNRAGNRGREQLLNVWP